MYSECEWYVIEDDVRTSAYESPIAGTGAALSHLQDGDSAWCAANDNDYLEVKYAYATIGCHLRLL